MRKKETDYNAKTEFLSEFELWRKGGKITHDEVTRKVGASRGTYANWTHPYEQGKPSVKLENIAKLSKWSGVPFKSECEAEQSEYDAIYKSLPKDF